MVIGDKMAYINKWATNRTSWKFKISGSCNKSNGNTKEEINEIKITSTEKSKV